MIVRADRQLPVGEPASAEGLYREHRPWLFGWLCKKVGCSHRAEDLAQDVFVRVIQGSKTVRVGQARALLTTIAKGLMVDHLLAYAGFAALCLAMDRHHEDVFGRGTPRVRRILLRLAGTLALGLSLWACAAGRGWSYGCVEWIGMLSLAGLLLIWVLTYRPRAALALGGLCALAAPAFALAGA